MISQADIASRVGRSPSAMSHMRKNSPALYRAVVLGVISEHDTGIRDATMSLMLLVNPKALPSATSLIYPDYKA